MDETIVLDANVILRYLLQDHSLSSEAEKLIKNHNLVARTEVVCEVVYVLQKVYSVDRKEVSEVLRRFMNLARMYNPEPAVIAGALDLYGDSRLDFVDCILIAVNKTEGLEIATFDKEMLKMLDN